MTTNYFANIQNLEDLKKEYRRLAAKHHPDVGGDTATMAEINNQYEGLFNRLKFEDGMSANPKYGNSAEKARDYIIVIEKLLKIKGICIELCGSWLWITGDTKPVKDQLKAAGCYYAPKKRCWYWRPATEKSYRSRGNYELPEIREKYGSAEIRARGQMVAV